MVEPISKAPTQERGFTLIEMLAAMLILSFGVTSMLGVFSAGLATEQSAELIRDSARLAQAVRERIEADGLLGDVGQAVPKPVRGATLPEFPGLSYDIDFNTSGPEGQSEVLVEVRVRWMRSGSGASETYRFPMPRGKPLYLRLRERR